MERRELTRRKLWDTSDERRPAERDALHRQRSGPIQVRREYQKSLVSSNAPSRSPWLTSRVVTGYVAAASAVILVLHALIVWALPRVCARVSSYSALPSEEENFAQAEEGAWLPRHIQAHGGRTIFAFQATRALLTSALFVLSIVGFWLEPDRQPAWVPAIHNATMVRTSFHPLPPLLMRACSCMRHF